MCTFVCLANCKRGSHEDCCATQDCSRSFLGLTWALELDSGRASDVPYHSIVPLS